MLYNPHSLRLLAGIAFCLLGSCLAQLSFHTDANSNSFTLKAPGLQQSFTRYFGASKPAASPHAAVNALEQQQQQQQQQQQLLATRDFQATKKRRIPISALNEPTERSIWLQTTSQQNTANTQFQSVYPQQYPIAGAGNYARFPPTSFSGATVGAVGGVAGGGAAVETTATPASYAALRAQLLQSSGTAGSVQPAAAPKVKKPTAATTAAAAAAGGKAGPTGTLQQQLQLLQQHQQQQQQQQQEQLQQQQQQQQLLHPNTPPPPTYSEQMQAAYATYMQQQRQYEQQQQHLLQQLYETFPQIPYSGFQEGGIRAQSNAADIARRPTSPNAAHLQQQQPGQSTSMPFYTAQQHYGFLQRQQDNILRDQHQVMHQHYNPNEPPKTIQMYGMAVPETSVLTSSPFSPASQVSHVNFSSGNVNYTF